MGIVAKKEEKKQSIKRENVNAPMVCGCECVCVFARDSSVAFFSIREKKGWRGGRARRCFFFLPLPPSRLSFTKNNNDFHFHLCFSFLTFVFFSCFHDSEGPAGGDAPPTKSGTRFPSFL